MAEQQKVVKVPMHDQMIQIATVQATRELNLEYVSLHQESLKDMEEGEVRSTEAGVDCTLKDGKIYFQRDETMQRHFDSVVSERVMALLLIQRSKAGQALLKKMWQFHVEQQISFVGENGEEYNPEDLPMYVAKKFGRLVDDNPDYVNQIAFIVMRVLQPVYAAELKGKPYINLATGEFITVASLIDGNKMFTKLRDMSALFEDEETTPEDQTELLNAAVNGTVADVKDAKAKIKGVTPITGKYIVRSVGENLYRVESEDLSEEQLQYIEKALGSGWEMELR